jgi:hypothetical protein
MSGDSIHRDPSQCRLFNGNIEWVKRDKERFPSGQREQTVNLPAMPSKVRILPSPPLFVIAGIAQLVERKPSKLGVAGSSPVSRSNLRGLMADRISEKSRVDKKSAMCQRPSTAVPR